MPVRRIVLTLLILAIAVPLVRWRCHLTPSAAIAGRFVVLDGDKTVLDRISGLHWERTPVFGGKFSDAVAWCAGNKSGLPGAGWRMPTWGELRQLSDRQSDFPGIDPVFAKGPSGYPIFWTATPVTIVGASEADAWNGSIRLVSLQDGAQEMVNIKLHPDTMEVVRCVRP